MLQRALPCIEPIGHPECRFLEDNRIDLDGYLSVKLDSFAIHEDLSHINTRSGILRHRHTHPHGLGLAGRHFPISGVVHYPVRIHPGQRPDGVPSGIRRGPTDMNIVHESGRDGLYLIPGIIFKRLERQAQTLEVLIASESELEGGVLPGGDFLYFGIRMGPCGLGKELLKRIDPGKGNTFIVPTGHNHRNRHCKGGYQGKEMFHN